MKAEAATRRGGPGQARLGATIMAMAVLESMLVHLPLGLEEGSAVAIPLHAAQCCRVGTCMDREPAVEGGD